MKKTIYIFALIWGISFVLKSQVVVTGTVKDELGNPIAGALVFKSDDPKKYAITKKDGTFVLPTNRGGELLEINYADKSMQKLLIPENGKIDVVLDANSSEINLGNSKTSELYKTQAVRTISGDEIVKNPSTYIPDALRGVSSYPLRGGISGSPLIVVDGFPRTWESLATEEIESINILKDAAATALWGVRGANGVIVVTTKRGIYNSKMIAVDYKYGMGFPTQLPEMADATTYAKAINEALYYDGLPARYSAADINAFSSGTGDPDLYPNVNWIKEGFSKHTYNNQLNISLRGGGDRIRYYSLINYKNSGGLLNPKYAEYDSRFSTQIKKTSLNVRSNLDIDITNSTLVKVTLLGVVNENVGPNSSTSNDVDIFQKFVNVPSAAFPVFTQSGVWGTDNIFRINPLANIGSVGYAKTNQRMLQSDLRIIQSLSAITKGLSAEVALAYDNNATFYEEQTKSYLSEVNSLVSDPVSGIATKNSVRLGNESSLTFNSYLNDQYIRSSMEGKLQYEHSFSKHNLNANFIYRQEQEMPRGRNEIRKRQYFLGLAGYNFDNRYLLDIVVNRYGTSVLPEGDQFRTFPAVSAAWIMSNESFMTSKAVDFLKLRASYGQSGLDNFGYDLHKQYWQQSGSYFLQDGNVGVYGTREGTLPILNLQPEVSTVANIGVDMTLFKRLSFAFDGFSARRSNIMVNSTNVISSSIGVELPELCAGITDAKGFEASLSWKDNSHPFKYYIQGNITYARTNVVENNEGYKPYSYLSAKGKPVGQFFGLEAIGYFQDSTDIANSPVQKFSTVRPGDIKYKDQNNDGEINQDDRKAFGYSTSMPEIYFGIKLGFEYKGFGLDAIFQGVANYTRLLNTPSIYQPLRNNTNISMWYLNDNIRWTEETKTTANLPRLSTLDNANNYQTSTQWLVDGSYLNLRSLNVFYNLPATFLSKIKLEKCQVYVAGNNLFMIDNIKYLSADNMTVGSPNMINYYAGLKINF